MEKEDEEYNDFNNFEDSMDTNSPIHNSIIIKINNEIEKNINNKEDKNNNPNWLDDDKITVSEIKSNDVSKLLNEDDNEKKEEEIIEEKKKDLIDNISQTENNNINKENDKYKNNTIQEILNEKTETENIELQLDEKINTMNLNKYEIKNENDEQNKNNGFNEFNLENNNNQNNFEINTENKNPENKSKKNSEIKKEKEINLTLNNIGGNKNENEINSDKNIENKEMNENNNKINTLESEQKDNSKIFDEKSIEMKKESKEKNYEDKENKNINNNQNSFLNIIKEEKEIKENKVIPKKTITDSSEVDYIYYNDFETNSKLEENNIKKEKEEEKNINKQEIDSSKIESIISRILGDNNTKKEENNIEEKSLKILSNITNNNSNSNIILSKDAEELVKNLTVKRNSTQKTFKIINLNKEFVNPKNIMNFENIENSNVNSIKSKKTFSYSSEKPILDVFGLSQDLHQIINIKKNILSPKNIIENNKELLNILCKIIKFLPEESEQEKSDKKLLFEFHKKISYLYSNSIDSKFLSLQKLLSINSNIDYYEELNNKYKINLIKADNLPPLLLKQNPSSPINNNSDNNIIKSDFERISKKFNNLHSHNVKNKELIENNEIKIKNLENIINSRPISKKNSRKELEEKYNIQKNELELNKKIFQKEIEMNQKKKERLLKEKMKLENDIKLIENQIEEDKLISKTIPFTKDNVLKQLEKEVSENYLIHQSLPMIKMKKMIPKPAFHFNSYFNDNKLIDSKLSKKADNVEIDSKRNIPEEIVIESKSKSLSKSNSKSISKKNYEDNYDNNSKNISKNNSQSLSKNSTKLLNKKNSRNINKILSESKYSGYSDFENLEEINLNQCD